MLVFLMLAGCAEPVGVDYRSGWTAIECEPFKGETAEWFAELDAGGEPRPITVLANAAGSETWTPAYVREWSISEDLQTVSFGASEADVTCRAWVAE